MSRFMLLILLVVCATGAPGVGCAVELMATPQAKYSLQPAKTYYAAGDTEAALSILQRYIVETPDSPNISEAYTLIGRILVEQQRSSDALFYLQRIPAQQRTADSTLLLVAALQQQQQMDSAASHLATLTADQFVAKQKVLYALVKSEDHLFRHQPLHALVVLRTALPQVEQSEQSQLVSQIHKILKQLDEPELAEAGFMFAATEVNDVLLLHSAQQALERGDIDLAQQIAEPLVSVARLFAAKLSAVAVLDQVYGRHWQQRAVGVVLPLSGRYAPFGELVRQGVELALSEAQTGSVRFIYRDSHADAQQAAVAVNELVHGDRVMAIIGPLMADAAQQSIAVAEAAKVPLLTLSHRHGLPQQGAYVFRNSLTSQQQVDILADYAIDGLGLNTYAILAPDSRAGQEFSRQFAEAIVSRGGDIIHQLTFAEQATDFRRQLLVMKGDEPEKADVGADGEPVEIETRPDWLPTVDFEALFIPAYAESVAMIAPQLAYYGIENVQLIGINGWNSPKLIQQAGRYTRGAVFADGFYPQGRQPHVASFVQRYKARFVDTPSILEAQSYDCAKIILTQLEQAEVTHSAQLQRSLLALENFSGVSGITGFDEQGEAKRQPILFKMGRRHIEPIEWTAVPQVVPEVESMNPLDSYRLHQR